MLWKNRKQSENQKNKPSGGDGVAIVRLAPRDYQKQARNYQDKEYGQAGKILDAILGIVSEAGEVAHVVREMNVEDLCRSTIYRTGAVEKARRELILELGDVLWYVSEMCDALGVEIEDVMAENIRKLEKRWPDGYKAEEEGER